MADIGNPINGSPRLVRLRTAPMPDPGEWCYRTTRGNDGAVLLRTMCALFVPSWCNYCSGGHAPIRESSDHCRRPQSCIDAAEVVE